MADPVFFAGEGPVSVAELAAYLKVEEPAGGGSLSISGVAALDSAGPADLTFFDNPRYEAAARATRAGACLVTARHAAMVAPGITRIIVSHPHAAFVSVSRKLYPTSLRPQSLFGATGVSPGAFVHPDARLEAGVIVDPGAIIGPGAEIGSGSVIAAGAVIGPRVRIGRDGAVGPSASVTHALIGNRVIIHAGARIGQDGFGYEPGRSGHVKVPQIGRVIIQDDVEIGANSAIDRGHVRDTVIGEGSKIDNLVQIAHNVVIGRHCIIVGHVAISGSVRLGDFVMVGGQSGINNHVVVGDGAQIAATSIVQNDVPAGARWGGWPAKPVREWFREVTTLAKLAQRG